MYVQQHFVDVAATVVVVVVCTIDLLKKYSFRITSQLSKHKDYLISSFINDRIMIDRFALISYLVELSEPFLYVTSILEFQFWLKNYVTYKNIVHSLFSEAFLILKYVGFWRQYVTSSNNFSCEPLFTSFPTTQTWLCSVDSLHRLLFRH